jgi:aminopeptidase N
MLSRVAAFEVRYHLTSPLFAITYALFFLLTFAATTIDQVQIGSAGQVYKNSPFALMQTVAIMNLFGIFVITAFVANAVVRDDETGFAPILRATPLGKADYVLGRFSGATLVAALAMTAVPTGVLIGSLMPWQDPEKIGPLVLGHYAYAVAVFSLPTVLAMAAGFFALATVTRSMMGCYIGVIGFLVLYTIAQTALQDSAWESWASLVDPFGIGAFFEATRYWTTTERNTLLPAFEGGLLRNRLLWSGIGLALVGVAYARFRMEPPSRRTSAADASFEAPPQMKPLARPSQGHGWPALVASMGSDMAFVFRSPAFAVLLALGLFNALGAFTTVSEVRGVPYFPVTRVMTQALSGAFAIIPIIIAIYYGGELVWRDRDYRMHEIVGASAAPNWTFVVPKILAIIVVLTSTLLVATLGAVGYQLFKGYTDVQLGGYLLWFILPLLVSATQQAVLSVFVQTLVPTKAAGWAMMLLYIVASVALASVGFEHRLYTYGDTPAVPLSDMNGMGHFWVAQTWLQVYWSAFALMLMVGAHLLWRRGTETRLRPRLALGVRRLRGTSGLLMAAGIVVWVSSGAFIFYNSNVLNRYITTPEREAMTAEAEKVLLPLERVPQPTITHVTLDVAIYPRERLAVTTGTYALVNRQAEPVTELIVRLNPDLTVERLEMAGAVLDRAYDDYGVRIYRLTSPLQSGDTAQLTFATRLQERGFPNSGAQRRLVDNGSFISNDDVAPTLGIGREMFLRDRAKRRKYGLTPEVRLASLEDEAANAHHYLRPDSDWVTAEIRLSTDADQTPVAPGMTVSDTVASGRRTLVTRTDAPIQHFFSMQSARYAQRTATWQGSQGQPVELTVYFHPEHAHNVQRMLDAMQASLDLFSTRFSPYQFRQARILEFPAYAAFAQSFANTVPFSEGIGFIQNFRDQDRDQTIDQVTYVTAHEIAHQWWAHQLIGANKQGMTMLSETFSQYSALLVMESLYGKAQIRKFLKTELDGYLRARGSEAIEELPLARVENQAYVHYNKGAVAMYGLKELVGEEPVNRALQRLLREFAFKAAPYPDTRDFLRLLREEVGAVHETLVTDLFERITLYDLKASAPVVRSLPDGRFETRVTIDAHKRVADGQGQESETSLDEAFDIGAFAVEPGKKGFSEAAVLSMERAPLRSGTQEVTIVTAKRPAFVGVDPYHVRIDRNSDDNVVPVPVDGQTLPR